MEILTGCHIIVITVYATAYENQEGVMQCSGLLTEIDGISLME